MAVNVCVVVGETRNKSSQRLEGRRLRPLIETQLEDVNDASDDDDIDHNEKKRDQSRRRTTSGVSVLTTLTAVHDNST